MEIKVVRQILEWNEDCHKEVQEELNENNVKMINIMGSPGAGKTTFILNLIDELPLKKEYKGLLKEMEGCIREGGSLCEGFKRGGELIPSFFNSMIDIGERTGKIVYVLRGLETFYSKLYYSRLYS